MNMEVLIIILKIMLITTSALPLGMYIILPVVFHFNKKMTVDDLSKYNLFVLWMVGILFVFIICLVIYLGIHYSDGLCDAFKTWF